MPTIFQITDTTIRMQFVQQVKVYVRHQNHLRIRSSLGTHAICRESKITRRKHTGLSILYIHIMYTR